MPPFTRPVLTGASRGLGRALALALAAPGARLGLLARPSPALDEAAAAVRARGAEALALGADLAQADADVLAARLHAFLGGAPDLLVLNAATLGPLPLRPLLDLDDAGLDEVLALNVAAPLRLVRRLVPGMVLAGRGTVLTLSSDAAIEAWPTWGAYGASKAALDHLARTLDAELAGTGVRVRVVDPGEMDTAMHAAAVPEADTAGLRRPEAVARVLLDRLAGPDEGAVRWVLPDPGGVA